MDWSEFLGRPSITPDTALAEFVAAGKSILITGAAGSIGSGLARTVLAGRPSTLILLDLSEGGLYETLRQIPLTQGVEVIPIIGSSADPRLLSDLFRRHRPDIILHAAAYKHVSLMEQNPFGAIANNAIGTWSLVTAAREFAISQLVIVSTDKAVHPKSIMGASKRISELAVLSHATGNTPMNAVRLGNVLGSSGSVVPLFQEQAQQGRTITVTHKDASRFFLTPAEVDVAILSAVATPVSGRILIPDCGKALPIVELARYIARTVQPANHPDLSIDFIGLRPGDKLNEELISESEGIESVNANGMRVVTSPVPEMTQIAQCMTQIIAAIGSFNLPALLDAVTRLVPDYQPSAALRNGSTQ